MSDSEDAGQERKETKVTPAMRDFLRLDAAPGSNAPDEIALTEEELRLKKIIDDASGPKKKSKNADGPARFIGGKDSNETGLER